MEGTFNVNIPEGELTGGGYLRLQVGRGLLSRVRWRSPVTMGWRVSPVTGHRRIEGCLKSGVGSNSVAELELEPQGAETFGGSWSWYLQVSAKSEPEPKQIVLAPLSLVQTWAWSVTGGVEGVF
jgi:hypothetical protein